MTTGAPGRPGLSFESLLGDGWLPLLVARHGRTTANAERRMVGRLDVPLDDLGRAQARALGRRLAGVPFQAACSSPLARARETLDLVLDEADLDLPIRIVADLAEWDQGVLEGRLERDLATGPFAAMREAWKQDPASIEIPGAEPLSGCQARVLAALESIVRMHGPPRPVLVVGHQVALASALCGLVGRPLSDLRSWIASNAALHVLGWREGTWRVVVFNDTEHLATLDGSVRPGAA
ncbi:MAG: histidine phosphatase family protein [Deltaproteobacteria bacterium]|nr:histidine phosphatase family protein [Deltaproteobacteria bacterium]